jgi:hypothetical protein
MTEIEPLEMVPMLDMVEHYGAPSLEAVAHSM